MIGKLLGKKVLLIGLFFISIIIGAATCISLIIPSIDNNVEIIPPTLPVTPTPEVTTESEALVRYNTPTPGPTIEVTVPTGGVTPTIFPTNILPTLPPEPTPTPTPTPTLEPTVTPIPTPTPTIIPTATPRYRPASSELEGELGDERLKFTSGPELSGYFITWSAESDVKFNPTEIQVYQVIRKDEPSDCVTERPIAFVTKSNGSGSNYLPSSVTREWVYCNNQYYVDQVPWLASLNWSVTEQVQDDWRKIPYRWFWSVKIDLLDTRVQDLEYHNRNYIVLVFQESEVIKKFWVEQ